MSIILRLSASSAVKYFDKGKKVWEPNEHEISDEKNVFSLSCVIIAVNQCTKLRLKLLQLLNAMPFHDICDKLCCRGQKIFIISFLSKQDKGDFG